MRRSGGKKQSAASNSRTAQLQQQQQQQQAIRNSMHDHLNHLNLNGEQEERAAFYSTRTLQNNQQHHHRQASDNNVKVSPSNQSLFLVSQQARQYGANYAAGQYQPYQQHLYQQLAGNNQHIYDSAGNVNSSSPEQMMQLMQRQQQQQQQLGGNFNRSMSSLHHIQQQQQPQQHRQPMTLKPSGNCQLLVLSAQDALKQQQIACAQQVRHLQLPGEGEGPLVALSSVSSQASSSSSVQSASHQQPATFGPNHAPAHQSERPLSNQCEPSGARHCAAAAAGPTGPQYCGSNYNDALKAAMVQQQQQGDLSHFRRQNSKQARNLQRNNQPAMIDHAHRQQQQQQLNQHQRLNSANQEDLAGNIYDVANYVMNK